MKIQLILLFPVCFAGEELKSTGWDGGKKTIREWVNQGKTFDPSMQQPPSTGWDGGKKTIREWVNQGKTFDPSMQQPPHEPQSVLYVTTDQNGKTFICMKCEPSTYVTDHCKKNYAHSSCANCEIGTFQSDYNQAESCESCGTCREKHQETANKCTRRNDIQCRCKTGYDWESEYEYCRKIDPSATVPTHAQSKKMSSSWAILMASVFSIFYI